jgi:hypothetical protein
MWIVFGIFDVKSQQKYGIDLETNILFYNMILIFC